MAIRDIRKEYSREEESGFRQIKHRTFAIGDADTLEGSSLQEGDTLPDDSTYEIIASEVQFIKPRSGKPGYSGRAVVVVAVLERVEADATGGKLWEELTGTRKVLDSDPQTLQYEITFTGLTASARPTNGQTYAEITGNASGFTTTGLDREPVAASVSQAKKATILKSHVTVVFEANHARTATGSSWTEINPRVLIRTGQKTYKGTRRFSGPVASSDAMENALYGSVFPNKSGKYAPKCFRVEVVDNKWPDRSLAIASYETPRIVGEGRLRIKAGFSTRAVTKDLDKNVIIGPEETSSGSKRYNERRLISGRAIRLEPFAIIVVETAATSFNLDTILNRANSVNKNTLPNFGNAKAGTLLFLGAPESTYEFVNGLWYVNLAFQYSGNPDKYPKWNQMTKSQAGTYFPRRVDGVDADGVKVAGATKYLLEWAPKILLSGGGLTDAPAPVEHRMFEKADFRDVGKHLLITGIS